MLLFAGSMIQDAKLKSPFVAGGAFDLPDTAWLLHAQSAARMVFYSCDAATGHTQRTENCLELMGIPSSGPTEQWSDLVFPDDHHHFEAAIQAISRRNPRYEVEYRVIHGVTGAVFWVLDRGQGDYDDLGKLRHVRGGIVEISRRVREEAEKTAAARAYTLAFEAARMGAWHLNVAKNFLSYTDELLILVGLERIHFDGTPEAMDKIIHPDDIGPWRAANNASLAPGGKLEIEFRVNLPNNGMRWFLSRGEVVRADDDAALECYGVMIDITERKIAEAAAARLAAIVTSSEDAIISTDLAGFVTSWNGSAERLLGFTAEEMAGKPISLIFPAETFPAQFSGQVATELGKKDATYESTRFRKDGSQVDLMLTVSPIRDGTQRLTGTSTIARDITERKAWEKYQAMLMRELSHRVKNTLAVIQAMMRQTLRSTSDPKAFAEAFEGRIRSLAASHALLTDSDWRGASLAAIIKDQLSGVVDDVERRFSLRGPDVVLPAETATQLGLLLHELATNATKYGALSNATGRIGIRWSSVAGKLHLTWRERGGPMIETPPHRTGFGTALIDSSVAKIHRRYHPQGLVCRIQLVL
jgi:PAS domain S-box-containing protein